MKKLFFLGVFALSFKRAYDIASILPLFMALTTAIL